MENSKLPAMGKIKIKIKNRKNYSAIRKALRNLGYNPDLGHYLMKGSPVKFLVAAYGHTNVMNHYYHDSQFDSCYTAGCREVFFKNGAIVDVK